MTEKEGRNGEVNDDENGAGDSQLNLFQVLDELAGIDSTDEDKALEELKTGTPEPLTPGFIDKVVASLPSPDSHPKESPPGRRSWLRPAVLIPIALALAAATPLVLVWSGRHSRTELSYEDAQHIVFETLHDVEYRRAALGRIFAQVRSGVRAIQDCAAGTGRLADEAREALELLLGLVTGDGTDDQVKRFPSGHYQETITRLQQEDLSEEEKLRGMPELLQAMQSGIVVLRRCKDLEPPLDLTAEIYSRKLERKIREGL